MTKDGIEKQKNTAQNLFANNVKLLPSFWTLTVVSAKFLLVQFVCLKETTCKTREMLFFYFTSKALFVPDIIKF